MSHCSEARGPACEGPASGPGRLRDREGDWAGRLRGGVRRQTQRHRQSLRHEDPEQVGDAQEVRFSLSSDSRGATRTGFY